MRSDKLTDDDPCPDCGNRTLTKRGITTASGGGATWLSCVNCEYEEYE
jgi:predicted nucleic-acid-binding Zn-ribbon protein